MLGNFAGIERGCKDNRAPLRLDIRQRRIRIGQTLAVTFGQRDHFGDALSVSPSHNGAPVTARLDPQKHGITPATNRYHVIAANTLGLKAIPDLLPDRLQGVIDRTAGRYDEHIDLIRIINYEDKRHVEDVFERIEPDLLLDHLDLFELLDAEFTAVLKNELSND